MHKELHDYLDEKIVDSYDLRDILLKSADIIIDINNDKFTPIIKSGILKLIGECEYRLTQSTDHRLAGHWLCAKIFLLITNIKNN